MGESTEAGAGSELQFRSKTAEPVKGVLVTRADGVWWFVPLLRVAEHKARQLYRSGGAVVDGGIVATSERALVQEFMEPGHFLVPWMKHRMTLDEVTTRATLSGLTPNATSRQGRASAFASWPTDGYVFELKRVEEMPMADADYGKEKTHEAEPTKREAGSTKCTNLLVHFVDGTVWSVPLWAVAAHKAWRLTRCDHWKQMAREDELAFATQVARDAAKYAENPEALAVWMAGSMTWGQLSAWATQVPDVVRDPTKMWEAGLRTVTVA